MKLHLDLVLDVDDNKCKEIIEKIISGDKIVQLPIDVILREYEVSNAYYTRRPTEQLELLATSVKKLDELKIV